MSNLVRLRRCVPFVLRALDGRPQWNIPGCAKKNSIARILQFEKEISVIGTSKQGMSAASVRNSRDEAQLVDRFLAGDKEAFVELIRPHVGPLYGVALAILKDEHDAEETVQEAVLKAMTHLAGFRRESKIQHVDYANHHQRRAHEVAQGAPPPLSLLG